MAAQVPKIIMQIPRNAVKPNGNGTPAAAAMNTIHNDANVPMAGKYLRFFMFWIIEGLKFPVLADV